MEESTADFIGQ